MTGSLKPYLAQLGRGESLSQTDAESAFGIIMDGDATAAQIGGMAKKGIVSYAYAASRWAALGYNQDDIVLLAADFGDASITIPVA